MTEEERLFSVEEANAMLPDLMKYLLFMLVTSQFRVCSFELRVCSNVKLETRDSKLIYCL